MDGGWTASDVAELLRVPTASDDKYSRGVLGVRTGSVEYPGAAVLGVEAAWRSGIGMVRYLGAEPVATLVLQRRPETVTSLGRVQAWLVGSGTDATSRTDAETLTIRGLLAAEAPVVVDAGALDLAPGARSPMIVTPHAREHERLRGLLGLHSGPLGSDEARLASARETAARLRGCVVLKGSRTLVATPGGWARELPSATPWLATAGTGDVLAGVIGAVVAGACAAAEARGTRLSADDLGPLAASGAWLHAHAAQLAVAAARGGPITALDVAGCLPAAVGSLRTSR